MTPDENNPRTSQIVFCNKKGEDQEPPVPGPSTQGVVVDSDKQGDESIGECFCPPAIMAGCHISNLCPPLQMDSALSELS